MADINKILEVELVLKQDKLVEDIKKTAGEVKQSGDVSARMDKVTARHQKELAKIDKQINDPRKKKKGLDGLKEANRLEQKKLNLIIRQNTELDKQNRKISRIAAAGGTGPPGPPPDGPPRGPGGGRGRGPRGGAAGAAAALGGAALTGIGVAIAGLIGAVSSQITSGYGKYSQYARGMVGLTGTGATYQGVNRLATRAVALGYDPIETVEQTRAAAIATGQAGSVTTAQMISRGTTLDVGQATNLMGVLTQAGTGFGGQAGTKGQRELRKTVALGFEAGIDKARIPEFITGVEQVVKLQMARQGGEVSASRYAQLLQAMGAGGAAGLQGARGAALFQKLNEAIVKPGGGETGQAMMMQAMGFGRPGGNATYYEALRQQERGADPTNVKALFRETRAQFGGGEEQILALREMTGASITQLEKLREVIEGVETTKSKKELEEILDKMKPIEEQSLTELEELGQQAILNADLTRGLIKIGEEARDGIVEIQKALNIFIAQFIPLATEALKNLGIVMSGIARRLGIEDPYRTGAGTGPQPGTVGIERRGGGPVWDWLTGKKSFDPSQSPTALDDPRQLKAFRTRGRFSEQEITAIQEIIQSDPALKKEFITAMGTTDTRDDEALAFKFATVLSAEVQKLVEAAVGISDATKEATQENNNGPAVKTSPPPMIAR